jgi:hypothetical protein
LFGVIDLALVTAEERGLSFEVRCRPSVKRRQRAKSIALGTAVHDA